MLIRTSSLLALACAACYSPRTGPVSDVPPVSTPAVSAPAQPPEPVATTAEQPAASPEREPAPAPAPTNTDSNAASANAQAAISPAERELRSQVHHAVDDGDYARARTLLDDFFTVPQLEKARVLLERGRPDEARVLTEEALTHAPGDPRALLMHGEACLRSGLRANDKAMIEQARLAFVKVGVTPAALLGASHAARELGRTDEALQLARDGWRASQAPDASDAGVPSCELAELTVARALWDAYAQERVAVNASAPQATSSPLFGETEGALTRLVERAPENAWGWYSLGELYEGAGRLDDAQHWLERGANALPSDALLATSLARVAQQRGGNAAVVAAFEGLERTQPASALPWWFAGRARFDDALAQLASAPVEGFRAAEGEFDKCLARGGTQLGNAAQYQAQCRTALGLCALDADKLDDALAQFGSVRDLYRGALGDQPSAALPSAAHGMELVADAFDKRGDPSKAAKIYLELHKFDGRNLAWAMSAGALHRKAGEARQLMAEDCALVAQGKITDERRIQALRERAKIDGDLTTDGKLRDQFRRKSEHLKETVPDFFNISWDCYLDATRLAPDNIRVLNDCAEVAVYRIAANLDPAEKLLRRAIELGKAQVDGAGASDEQRPTLIEALGDAYQNLGKLLLEGKNDPKSAKALFEQSVAISPPRPVVTDSYLPKCEKLLRAKKN
jgi:tetratricopeptide (TPR) repeat protein